MLKMIADKKNLIKLVLAGILLVLWVLYLIFGSSEQKTMFLVLTPVLAAVIYGFVRLLFKPIGKNASPKIMAVFVGFYLIVGTLGFLMMTVEFVSAFPNGFSPTLGACAGLVSAALDEYTKG